MNGTLPRRAGEAQMAQVAWLPGKDKAGMMEVKPGSEAQGGTGGEDSTDTSLEALWPGLEPSLSWVVWKQQI
jgi:hypothetical protein